MIPLVEATLALFQEFWRALEGTVDVVVKLTGFSQSLIFFEAWLREMMREIVPKPEPEGAHSPGGFEGDSFEVKTVFFSQNWFSLPFQCLSSQDSYSALSDVSATLAPASRELT